MIEIKNLYLRLSNFALTGIDLTVKKGDLFILVGPSGSGKTLLLETIAGLRRITSGTVKIGGKDVTFLEPEKRRIGMVYQDCALFPHLTVAENIAFGLKIRRVPVSRIRRELDKVAELFDILHLFDRMPDALSGGEEQKVALARAMVINPEVLLLDEPLSSLDPQTSEGVRQEIVRLNSELGITMINVTHDFEEAVSIGTRAAVIGDGEIRQIGLPCQIFEHPNSKFVARFTMAVNVFQGISFKDANGVTVCSFHGITLKTDFQPIGDCFVSVRPESISISLSPETSREFNVISAVISQILNRGSIVTIVADVPPSFTCLVTRNMLDSMDIKVGQKIYLNISRKDVTLFKD